MENLTYTLIAFHHKFAILQHKEYGTLSFPIKHLPPNININDSIILTPSILTHKSPSSSSSTLTAEELLEKLIN